MFCRDYSPHFFGCRVCDRTCVMHVLWLYAAFFAGMILSRLSWYDYLQTSIPVQCSCYKRTRIIRPNGGTGPNSQVAVEFPNGALRQRSGATAVVYIHHAPCLAWQSVSVFPGAFINVLQSDLFLMSSPFFYICLWMKNTSFSFIDNLTTQFQLHSVEMNERLTRNGESSRSFRRQSYEGESNEKP
jgi:hypothetical protein